MWQQVVWARDGHSSDAEKTRFSRPTTDPIATVAVVAQELIAGTRGEELRSPLVLSGVVEPTRDAVEELVSVLKNSDAAIDRALFLFSECLQQRNDVAHDGSLMLDELADEIRKSSGGGEVDIDTLVRSLFVDLGFVGDIENYHGEENSFLDRVLARRTGMPITLSAVVVAVGSRLGLDLSMIGLPGHVVVGVRGKSDTFVDAFSGTLVDRSGLSQRMRSIFGKDVELSDDRLVPMTSAAVITRVSNNLMRTWAEEPTKFDHLLELRAVLPLERADQRMLVEIAEARARFDIAAKVRAAIDPADPMIDQMWGRLN